MISCQISYINAKRMSDPQSITQGEEAAIDRESNKRPLARGETQKWWGAPWPWSVSRRHKSQAKGPACLVPPQQSLFGFIVLSSASTTCSPCRNHQVVLWDKEETGKTQILCLGVRGHFKSYFIHHLIWSYQEKANTDSITCWNSTQLKKSGAMNPGNCLHGWYKCRPAFGLQR